MPSRSPCSLHSSPQGSRERLKEATLAAQALRILSPEPFRSRGTCSASAWGHVVTGHLAAYLRASAKQPEPKASDTHSDLPTYERRHLLALSFGSYLFPDLEGKMEDKTQKRVTYMVLSHTDDFIPIAILLLTPFCSWKNWGSLKSDI